MQGGFGVPAQLCILSIFFYSYTIVTGLNTNYYPLNTPNYVSHLPIATIYFAKSLN